jgi:hypothetical protein
MVSTFRVKDGDHILVDVTPECKRPEMAPALALGFFNPERKSNPVEGIYLLDEGNQCQDVCVVILRDPVRLNGNGKIVPGIPLSELWVVENLEVNSWESLLGMVTNHIVASGEKGKQPFAIGYGCSGVIDHEKFKEFANGVSPSLEMELTGSGVKRVVHLRGLDLAVNPYERHIMACNCAHRYMLDVGNSIKMMELNDGEVSLLVRSASYHVGLARGVGLSKVDKSKLESARECIAQARENMEKTRKCVDQGRVKLEGFRVSKSLDSRAQIGEGFSGSLIFINRNEGGFHFYGIYSGALFTNEVKDFIKNAAQYHRENYGRGIIARCLLL